MNEKEVGELRRRFRPDKSNITHIRGCYVNESGEIVSEFDQAVSMLSQDDAEMLLSTLRRTLSGSLGKNLTDIVFETRQVADSDEHRLLMALRDPATGDPGVLRTFYERVIGSLDIEGGYLILLARDTYDVPYRGRDGEKQEDASSEVFSYLLCSICPVKLTRPALSYAPHENQFRHLGLDWVVAAPELGFLFPAFDDRSTNLYGALYYSRDLAQNHQSFVDAVFRRQAPMPPAAQRETFSSVLEDALADTCSMELVQAVHEQFCGMIAEHKESKVPEPLVLTKGAVKGVLKTCGVDDAHVTEFEARYDEAFGPEADLSPKNVVDPKQLEVSTPDVTIRVKPERSDLIETRVIDGARYILIRADEGVEVNGIDIHIS